jgi:uncharacterized protein YoxC
MIHTFKEEYVTRAKALESSVELDLHVNDIVEQAKESMSQDATAIRMQTQNLIDKKNRLLLDAHNRCEAALAAVHSRMKDASKAYGDAYEEALNQQLKIVTESTITEDTLNQEMVIAANAHRNSIQRMTAIPPLVMDDTRLQLQIRCAAAEEKAEDLQRELRVIAGKDSNGKIASLHDRMKSTDQMDESVMIGLKKKLEAAESELESLKRKRADSISPERGIISILKRPAASSPSGQNVPSSSAQQLRKSHGTGRTGGMTTPQACLPRYLPPLPTGTV